MFDACNRGFPWVSYNKWVKKTMSSSLRIPTFRLMSALLLLLMSRSSDHEKTFILRHDSVKFQIADVVIMVEMAETTTDQQMLDLMKINTIELLSQLQIGGDQVRVALIAIGEDKAVHVNPSLRKPDDYKSVVVATLNEGTNMNELKNKINGMKIYRYTPCSLAEEAAEKVILQEKNGDRPDVPNILIYMTSFCCSDKMGNLSQQIMNKWKTEKTFLAMIALVYNSKPMRCTKQQSIAIGKTVANNNEHFALLDNFNFRKIGTLEVLKRAIACRQTVHVGDCDWNAAGAGTHKCARRMRISDLSNEKCKQAVPEPYTAQKYFGSNPLECADTEVAICPANNKKYIRLNQRQKMPKLDDEYLDIDARQDLIHCRKTLPLPICPNTTTASKTTTTTFDQTTTTAFDQTSTTVRSTFATESTSVSSTNQLFVRTSSTTTSSRTKSFPSPSPRGNCGIVPKNVTCYLLLSNLKNIKEIMERIESLGCWIDTKLFEKNVNQETKKKLCRNLDFMRICKSWLDQLQLSPYDLCPDVEDGYYRSIFETKKSSESGGNLWWILVLFLIICFLIVLLIGLFLLRRRKRKTAQNHAIAAKELKGRDRGLSAEMTDHSATSSKKTGLSQSKTSPFALSKKSISHRNSPEKNQARMSHGKAPKIHVTKKGFKKQRRTQPANSNAVPKGAGKKKNGFSKN